MFLNYKKDIFCSLELHQTRFFSSENKTNLIEKHTMKIKNLLSLFAVLLLLQACGLRSVNSSYVGEVENKGIYSLIAKDLVLHLSQEYPSGYTEMSLEISSSKRSKKPQKLDEFSMAFEEELRKKGYTLMPSALLKLSYTFDSLENGENYVQLRYANTALARMYDKNGNALALWTKEVRE